MRTLLVSLCTLALAASACSSRSGTSGEDNLGAAPTPADNRPDDRDDDDHDPKREIVESDLYRVDDDQLYTYNYTKGLYAIDVAVPEAPAIRAQAAIFGPAGELYARQGIVLLILDDASTACIAPTGMPVSYEASELIALTDAADTLDVEGRVCVAGKVVATRLLGNMLYAVTFDSSVGKSYAMSLDVSNPTQLRLADIVELTGDAHEIHMNNVALFVAQPVVDENGWSRDTTVTYLDITAIDGTIAERGSFTVRGAPQGRFHMNATPTHFRIVTFDENNWTSVLHIADISDPDTIAAVSNLNVGHNEQLYATRFVDDRAYIVTFRQTDPLWVIDLREPEAPVLLGELWVPGWSDFIFPRDNGELVTVGRGPSMGVAVALFDVSDPQNPTQKDTEEWGYWDTQSEANSDHRGATIIEAGVLGEDAMVVVPTATESWNYEVGEYDCQTSVQLVDLRPGELRARGNIDGKGAAVRRTFPVGDRLYSLSDLEVAAVDVTNRDAPAVDAALETGNLQLATNACSWSDDWGNPGPPMGDWVGDDTWGDGDMYYGCHVSAPRDRGIPAGAAVLGLIGIAFAIRRRRRR